MCRIPGNDNDRHADRRNALVEAFRGDFLENRISLDELLDFMAEQIIRKDELYAENIKLNERLFAMTMERITSGP